MKWLQPVAANLLVVQTGRDVNEARTLEAEATTLEAEAEARTLEAEARTLEAKTEAKAEFVQFWPLEL